MRRVSRYRGLLALCAGCICWTMPFHAQTPHVVNASGLQLRVAGENTQPTLRAILPGRAEEDRTIEILFPEHITARPQGASEGEHLYLFRPGKQGEPPQWRQTARSLEYEREFKGVHVLARATLEEDGLLIHYEFANRPR